MYYRGSKASPRWAHGSHSSSGQDTTIMEIFNHKRAGFFVDLAAHDAAFASNTLALEVELGWQGVCIEPNPENWPGLLERQVSVEGCRHCRIGRGERCRVTFFECQKSHAAVPYL